MNPVLDMLYPRTCLRCGRSTPKAFRYICWECWADSPRLEPPFCQICGDPVSGAIEHEYTCYACAAERPAFKFARSTTRYEGVVGEAVRDLKYNRAMWLAPDLASLLHRCVLAEYPETSFDWIVPVPLFRVRRRARGYNQSALLARALARQMSGRMRGDLLRRIRPTTTQTNLTASERLANVVGAFEYRKPKALEGRCILLVDDVMTTGATVNVCSKELMKGGAQSVYVVTVARR